MKPGCHCSNGRKQFPQTDYFFHSGSDGWRGYSSSFDGEDRSEFRTFYNLSRDSNCKKFEIPIDPPHQMRTNTPASHQTLNERNSRSAETASCRYCNDIRVSSPLIHNLDRSSERCHIDCE